jgi:Family of unknown function (DUF5343)
MNNGIQTEYTPPYLSNSKLELLFEVVSTRNFQNLSPNDLQSRNFSNSDSFLGIKTLKFLTFIDDRGKVSDNMRVLFLKGEENQKRLQEIIKQAYHKLYARNPSAEKLSRDELYNEFISEYRLSSRVASPTVSAFIWLCRKSGLLATKDAPNSTSKKISQRNTTAIHKNTSEETNNKVKKIHSTFHTFNISGIILEIPKNHVVDEAIISGELAEVKKALDTFAKSTGLNTKSQR